MAHFMDTSILPEGVETLFQRSTVSLTLADALCDDMPLFAVNDAFLSMTGYSPEMALGKNCRFLQPDNGPGPVRERMRDFIHNSNSPQAKFVVPNVRRDGTPFLNLLYMSRLFRGGECAMILGSQFEVSKHSETSFELYELALKQDLRQMKMALSESGWAAMGTYDALASSHSLIVQARLDG